MNFQGNLAQFTAISKLNEFGMLEKVEESLLISTFDEDFSK